MLLIKTERGIGLLELILALAIISILLLMATRYFRLADLSRATNDATQTIQVLNSAAQRWYLTHYNYTDIKSIDDLIKYDLLAKDFPQTNPWGGGITAVGAIDQKKLPYLLVKLMKIPSTACYRLSDSFKSVICPPTGVGGVKCDCDKDNSCAFSVNLYPCTNQ